MAAGGVHARPRRRALLGGLAVAVALCALWNPTYTRRPVEATSDVYTHLMVARHLIRGEGFRTDIAYPLSFAWPFARELPQPLLHRAPGFALLLTAPVALSGGNADRSLAAVRVVQLVILSGLVWLGSAAWFARGRPGAAVGWAVLLAAHPLLGYAVDRGHDELPAALVLLACWLRHRDGARQPGATDGVLLALLALLRPELWWLPVLWWLLRRPSRPAPRALAAAGLALLVVAGPWAVRNARLTGNPFFSLQTSAEHVKDTRSFPGYAVYRQLEPQPLLRTLLADPQPTLRKTWRGLRFFWREADSFLPRPVVIVFLACGVVLAGRRLGPRRRRSQAAAEDRGEGTLGDNFGPLGLSLALVAGLYAPFDHSVRHLEVLLPVVAWELGPFLAERPWAFLADRLGHAGDRHRPRAHPWLAGAAAGLVAFALVLVAVPAPTGWTGAPETTDLVARETRYLRAAPPGVVFAQTAAAPWQADRPVVWDPGDEGLRATIRALLETGP